MKFKVRATITVGSKWGELEHFNRMRVPEGGKFDRISVKFEHSGGTGWTKALANAIEEELGRPDFHIWHWSVEVEDE